MSDATQLPLVYSCSGASSAAQMANSIAVKLDRLKVAEMSCIAGVGGDVEPLVRTAKSGRPIIVIEGCPFQCVRQILQRHGIQADKYYDLSKSAVKNRMHGDFDPTEANRVLKQILADPGFPGRKRLANLCGETADQPRGYASPPCYLAEFED